MAATRLALVVHTEDDQREVLADQRDIAAFERAERVGFPTAMDIMPMACFRYLAWHAQVRTEQIDPKTAFAAWDKVVVEVEAKDDGEDAAVDPGPPGAHAATS